MRGASHRKRRSTTELCSANDDTMCTCEKTMVDTYLTRKEQCGTKIICVFNNFYFLHFHRLPYALENARVLYKIKRKFASFR